MTKVLVVGLDGATFDLIMPLAEKGTLPNIRKLIEEDVSGSLESTIPPVTGPAWVSFATGANPGKHGCFDFLKPKKSLNASSTISSSDIAVQTFYEILERNGYACTIINLPVSHPPRTKGVTITSLLGKKDRFIFPPNLVDEVPELREYRIVPDMTLLARNKTIEYLQDIRNVERVRFECAKKLFKSRWDFFFVLFGATDWLQHILFRELITGQLNSDHVAFSILRDLDRYVGWFVENLPRKTCLFLISDHGFRTYEAIFYVNEWLRKEGYQKARKSKDTTKSANIFEEELTEAGKKELINIPIPYFFWKLPGWSRIGNWYRVLKRILPVIPKVNLEFDTLKTVAACITSSSKSIYLNREQIFLDGIVKEEEYEGIRSQIIDKLNSLRDSRTKRRIFDHVWTKEEVYEGPLLSLAPDIILSSKTHKIISGVYPKIIDRVESNDHASDGIFLAHGEGIRQRSRVQGLQITDIAPLILHIFGCPIPEFMDGKVRKEIFAETSEFHSRKVLVKKISEEDRISQKVRELKRLGKLG